MGNIWELFRNEPGFHKLFIRFKDRYRSLDRVGGAAKIADFSEEEFAAIAGFMALSPHELKIKPAVSLRKFEEQLANTNLAGLTLRQLLEVYFDEPLISKAEEQLKTTGEAKGFYGRLAVEHPHLGWWFQRILQKQPDTRFIQVLYKQDKQNLERMLQNVVKAFDRLPEHGQYERLPLFSQRITGNPHSFDRNRTQGKLLLHLLAANQAEQGNKESSAWKHTEQINELLLNYGILRDDLWNFVTCRGFKAYQRGEEHPVWRAAAACRTVMNIPVRELTTLDAIRPFAGKTVWVVENSGVCSAIMDEVADEPLVCTHGQFKAASWIFLDRLVESGCIIYYAGDMDPEGLLMAQKLKNRYPENTRLWRMDPESYYLTMSEEKIEDRVNQLRNIDDPELKKTADVMMEYGFAAYQEGLVELLVSDIQKVSFKTL
ncbi:TIGR02679 family protein [Peribacillus cavernae]|uniref:TIGR02679 family protein n=1 Tax=Peribacillus cavernae TaxID=1674310 RepID=A0A3S0U0D1_9BACI|nr:TIGR02679 family protein [Peribacillus cavernae]MDQ0219232.1 uncharacterized protein (TIGR02679 family) [Peribacillus cavernae]RUQ28554.1 TIGR02679 family protein [Peribacillus cavernae]